MLLHRDSAAGHAASGIDDFTYRKTAAVAEVVEQRRGGVAERGQCEDVRSGEVVDVDVVAYAGAVGRGVIVAVDADAGARPRATSRMMGSGASRARGLRRIRRSHRRR